MSHTGSVRIGIQLSPQHAQYGAIREAVAEVEELGADAVFNWDHFYPLSGEPDGLHFEAWTEIAAWAEQTSRIQIGSLVNCNSYRNADLQADMARTIDHISAQYGTGRFIFGTGAGWFKRDYDEYGYEFGTPGSRLNDLAEALPRIEQRWSVLNPAPTRKIPVLIGGGGEKKTLRLVAKHADIWHSFATGDLLVHKLSVLKEHCQAVGRDISEIELSTGTDGAAEGASLIDHVEAQYKLGVRLFIPSASGPAYDLSELRTLLQWRDEKNAL